MAKKKKKMHRIGPGNEKWKHYDNPKCRKLWGKLSDASTLSIKLKNHSSKLLLYIQRDQLSLVYKKLVKQSKNIIGDHAFQQNMGRKTTAVQAETQNILQNMKPNWEC